MFKRKFLMLCVFCFLAFGKEARAMPAGYSFIQECVYVIAHNESGGDYGAVNAADVISVGLFQWYGSRAYDLCYSIYATIGDSRTRSILGDTLTDELSQNVSSLWSNYYPSASDRANFSSFLTQPEAQAIQDELAQTDAWVYVKRAQNYGLSDPAAIIYFCDLYNQSPKQSQNILAALGGAAYANNLDRLHAGAMNNSIMSQYSTRRNWTYNELKSWGGETEPVKPPPGGDLVGGGENGGVYATDYIIPITGGLILYNSQFPNGRVYFAGNHIFYPKNT